MLRKFAQVALVGLAAMLPLIVVGPAGASSVTYGPDVVVGSCTACTSGPVVAAPSSGQQFVVEGYVCVDTVAAGSASAFLVDASGVQWLPLACAAGTPSYSPLFISLSPVDFALSLSDPSSTDALDVTVYGFYEMIPVASGFPAGVLVDGFLTLGMFIVLGFVISAVKAGMA